MTFKKSLLIALLSFGIANTVLAETYDEKFSQAYKAHKQQNYSVSVPLFKELAEQGDALAQSYLSSIYSNGEGVAKSDKQAFYWQKKAAEQGVSLAQYSLGVMYSDGRGVAKNDKQAIYWYKKAAEQGYSSAQYNLAVGYAKGKGVTQDFSKAKYYLSLACNKGHQEACRWYTKFEEMGVK